ncbi:MAG: bifunctional 2',3'-cyclic-nucleotide 2'-phosphodiesterase/3'-nucleotidase [Xanthomonadaceae bacterium]|nr:bifunctional 2',3'-cyclic-nucleotide 2'-phosphodiesterase/3'-nucleotidase [Xanthomonadaceae bacterium]
MNRLLLPLVCTLALAACASISQHPADGTRARIGVLETTDLHSNVMSYDYYKLAPDDSLGLERAATLIGQARKEFHNTLLFDDGDTIQGTALADYQALVKQPACKQELAIYKAMDTLHYDAGTIGNHEFNYGLTFLSRVTGTPFDASGVPVEHCKGPDFPLVLANVFSARTGRPLYAPWRILTRTIRARARDGSEREATIRVGVIGFTPPPILEWDKRNLDGKVTVTGVVEAAKKYVPEMREAGVDIVVALVHGGINTAPYTSDMENADWYLAQVPGIDAMLTGHSHAIFPDPHNLRSRYAHMRDVDNQRGFVNGVPAVMGDYFGKAIGVIDLRLRYADGRWQVDRQATHSQVRLVEPRGGRPVAPDEGIARIAAPEHAATIAYVKTPIGRSDFAMTTYFVAAGDTSALTLVNAAQRDYVEKYIKTNLPQYADVPVLSAAAPFKAGFGGPNDYTDVPAGPLAINNAADLYLYPNTLTAVKIDGAGVKVWLEKSAQWFNRIDPRDAKPQELINRRFPTYNFDVLQADSIGGGLTYAIDVTKQAGGRIEALRYRGKPVAPGQAFIVVTNNYRASGGGGFPGLDGSNTVLSAPDANRDVLIDYVRAAREITRAQYGNDRNWRFAKVKTVGPIVFTSAAGKRDIARGAGIDNVSVFKDNGDGTAVYTIDLSR